MPNREFSSNDWLVFIDGVQVPFINLQMTFPMSGIASGVIALEPDILLTRIRPRSVVAIFVRDRFSAEEFTSKEEEVLGSYFYYAGGEVVQLADSREAQSRSTTITFESDFNIYAQHSAFASGVGGAPFYGTINGSNYVNPETGTSHPQDVLSVAALSKAFTVGAPTGDGTVHRSTGEGGTGDFGNRLTELVSFLSSHNASLRVQTARTRLLNKIAAIDDNTLGQLAKVSLASPLFQLVQNRTTSQDSMLDVIMKFANTVNYRMLTSPAPSVPTDQPPPGNPEKIPFPPALVANREDTDIFQFRRDWYRNDYIFVPNLFYSAPPPCNFIFPDMLGSRSTVRNFMAEPTRSYYVDSVFKVGGSLVYVEPPDIIRPDSDTLLTPTDFWVLYRDLLNRSSTDQSAKDSPYRGASPIAPNGVEVLNLLQDDELEKGILSYPVPPHGEYVMALARFLALKNPDGTFDSEAVANIATIVGKAFDEDTAPSGPEDEKTRAYVQFIVLWLRYQHQLRRYNRPSQVQLRGHRWLVPGFSTVIFDSDMTYLSYITSLTYIVGADGSETTSVALDHTRPIQVARQTQIAGLKASVNDTVRIREALVADIEQRFAEDYEDYQTRLDRMFNNRAIIDRRREEYEAASTQLEQNTIRRELLSVARLFESDYVEIMARARVLADSVGGPGKTPAGSVLVRQNPDLASALLAYLDPSEEVSDPAAFENLNAALTQAEDAVSLISQYNDQQLSQFRQGQPAEGQGSAIIAAINQAQEAKRDQAKALEQQIADLERSADFPTPPIFYNNEFLDLEKLDERYQELLGCQPFYTGPYAEGIDVGNPSEDKDIRRATAYIQHQKMIQMFSRVFDGVRRVTASLIETDDTERAGDLIIPKRPSNKDASIMSWEEAAESDLGSFRWQHENFLRRRAQTLKGYLRTHGFKEELEVHISDEPDPTKFYRMVPRTATPVGKLVWDESVLCRLVDENLRTGEQITINGETQPRAADELIRRRREKVTNPFLTTGPRQNVILSYSRRHFGSRGFDGK